MKKRGFAEPIDDYTFFPVDPDVGMGCLIPVKLD